MYQLTSEQIRILRHSRGLGQKEVAAKMSITKQRYCEMENHGDLKKETLERILKALNYSFESAKKFLDALPPPNGNITPDSKK